MGAATTAAATGRASLRALAALAVAWREAATAARPTRARGLAAAAKGPGAAQRTLDAAARNAMLDNARAVAARDERTAQAAEGIRALVDANAAELQAHVRNPAESRAMVLSMLNAHEGINSTLIRGLSLAMDPVELSRDSLRNLVSDQGETFEGEFEDYDEGKDGDAVLTVRRCFYKDFFETEGEPALTSIFCALEAAPFEAFARDGRVAFAAPRTLAQGAESCELRLSKVEGARHPFLSWASQGG